MTDLFIWLLQTFCVLFSNSARTAVYEPSSGASVTIQIPNIVDR